MLFGLPPLLVLWVVRAVSSRRLVPVLIHLAVAAGAAFVLSAWYVVPFVRQLLGDRPGPRHPDSLMVVSSLEQAPGLPLAVGIAAAVVMLVGLVLTLARLGDVRAQSIAVLIVGAVVVSGVAYVNVVRGGETLYSYRSATWLLIVTASAVALFFPSRRSWRSALARLSQGPPGAGSTTPARRRAVAAVLVVVVGVPSAFAFWSTVHAPIDPLQTAAAAPDDEVWTLPPALAYRTPLENCQAPQGTPADVPLLECYPASAVESAVDAQLGAGARPIVLGEDRSSVFAPYFQVVAQNGGATGPLDRYAQRLAAVRQLAATRDPQRFRARAQSMRFGPVSVLVLRIGRKGALSWSAQAYLSKERIAFRRSQFPVTLWAVTTVGKTFIAVARPSPIPEPPSTGPSPTPPAAPSATASVTPSAPPPAAPSADVTSPRATSAGSATPAP